MCLYVGGLGYQYMCVTVGRCVRLPVYVRDCGKVGQVASVYVVVCVVRLGH